MLPESNPPAAQTITESRISNNPKTSFKFLRKLFGGQAAREGYLAAIDQAVISLSNFLATIILARNANPTQLGVYGVGFIGLRLIRCLQDGLIIQPVNVFGAGLDEHAFKRYVTSSTVIQILLAVVSAAAIALGGWVLTALGNDIAGPTLFALWFATLFTQLQEHIRRILYTRGEVFQAVINTILANGSRLALMVVWANHDQLNGISSLHAIAWGSVGALLPGLLSTRRYWTRQPDNPLETWKKNWDFGRWMLGGTIASWVAVEFYPVLTAGMISFAAVGAYRALQNIVAPIHLLMRAIDTFLTPRAARYFTQGGHRALNRTMGLVYLIAGLPVAGMLVIGLLFPSQILHLLYGDTYLEYSRGILLMALFYALLFVSWPLQTTFKAARLSRPIFIANLVAIASMLTFGIWAIYMWGVYGTILGQALNALILAIILWSAWIVAVKKGKG
jgi:O-antigen/teichoic acid export membrane protein